MALEQTRTAAASALLLLAMVVTTLVACSDDGGSDPPVEETDVDATVQDADDEVSSEDADASPDTSTDTSTDGPDTSIDDPDTSTEDADADADAVADSEDTADTDADVELGGLPNCTIHFDSGCPDATAECGATFSGGGGCTSLGVGSCYASGIFAYSVPDSDDLTISFDDDVFVIELLFAHERTGEGGMMTFFNEGGGEVDSAVATNGACRAGMPDMQRIVFSEAVRRIEVSASSGNLWLDAFEIN